MFKKSNIIIGTVFVIIGAVFLLKNLNILDFYFNIFDLGFYIARLWPALFLIIPGLLFHLSFFSGKNRDPGLLVPGGILLVLGITFQINMLYGGWDILWPAYILSVAVGLFELYMFGQRDKGLLIPIGILGGLSVIFFTRFSLTGVLGLDLSKFIVPVVLVVLGVLVLSKGRPKKKGF